MSVTLGMRLGCGVKPVAIRVSDREDMIFREAARRYRMPASDLMLVHLISIIMGWRTDFDRTHPVQRMLDKIIEKHPIADPASDPLFQKYCQRWNHIRRALSNTRGSPV